MSTRHIMRQLQLAFVFLAAISACGFAAEPPSSASLIANGDFEGDADSDQWPDGWARAKSGITWCEDEGNPFSATRFREAGRDGSALSRSEVVRRMPSTHAELANALLGFEPGEATVV